jgi:hypothetical protein
MAMTLCARCDRTASLAFGLDGTERRHCLRCALTDRRLLQRALRISMVVGTMLTAINQGTILISGAWPSSLFWQIPLTYAVPFSVAMWSALTTLRIPPAGSKLKD